MRVAAACCDAAVEALRDEVAPGLEERHLQAVIEDAFLGTGAQPAASFALSTPMSEPGVCVPRQILSDRRIQAGDVIVTEITAVYWGYSSQILRTLTVGADPTELYRRLHELALDRYRAAGVCRPGSTVGEILDLAEPIHEAGLSIWDDLFHGFGGGGYFSPVLLHPADGRRRHVRNGTAGRGLGWWWRSPTSSPPMPGPGSKWATPWS